MGLSNWRLAKLSADGAVAWVRELASDGVFYRGLAVGQAGDAYLVGSTFDSQGALYFDIARLTSDGTELALICEHCGDPLVFAAGRNGHLAFAQKAFPDHPGFGPFDGTAIIDAAQRNPTPRIVTPPMKAAIAFSPDETLVVVGVPAATPDAPLAVTKLSLSVPGQVFWRVDSPAGMSFTRTTLSDVAVTGSGTIVFVAQLTGNGTWGADAISADPLTLYLLALSQYGEPVWARRLPPSFGTYPGELSLSAAADRIYLAAPNGCNQFTVQEYDGLGALLGTADLVMTECIPGFTGTSPFRVSASDNAVFVTGRIFGSLHVSGKTIVRTGNTQGFLVKMKPTPSTAAAQ